LKERLDIRLLGEGLFPTREKARKSIQNGLVTVNGQVVTKPGTMVPEDAELAVLAELHPFVGRGGLKLEHMLERCSISVEDCVAMDIGASTGGFTDCMLRRGARKVYAVDAGRDQLDPSLRADARVVNAEQTNVRYLEPAHFGELMDFACMDVSFISVTKLFAAVTAQLKDGASLVCLIKPQFEAGPENLGKNGIVVRNKKVHGAVLLGVTQMAKQCNLGLRDLTFSPITGGSGNVEYLAHFQKGAADALELTASVSERIANEAFLYHSKSGEGRNS